jgi:predicted transcriptional regulator
MKRATITLSLETQERLKRLASHMHTARICIMHRALHGYAKALRYPTQQRASVLRKSQHPKRGRRRHRR